MYFVAIHSDVFFFRVLFFLPSHTSALLCFPQFVRPNPVPPLVRATRLQRCFKPSEKLTAFYSLDYLIGSFFISSDQVIKHSFVFGRRRRADAISSFSCISQLCFLLTYSAGSKYSLCLIYQSAANILGWSTEIG